MDFVITQKRRPLTVPDSNLLYRVEKCQDTVSNLMSATTPALYALHTVRINVGDDHDAYNKQLFMGPWRTFVEAIFLLPALETLELEAPWFSEGEAFPSLTLLHANLRRFIYRAPLAWSRQTIRTPGYGRRSAEQTAVETRNLRLLLDANRDTLDANRDTLEILELPGELADDLLDATFPSLRELSLFGYGPIYHTWARALPPQSNFQKLHIEIVSSSSPSPSPVASHLTCSQLSKMRSLTLSNPHPDDPLFGMLPSNLEHLSLVPYPEPFMLWMLPESEIPVNIIPCSGITTVLTSGVLGNLVSLNISYRWESDQAEVFLLGLIPRTSPYLEFLELNRYGWKGSPFDVLSSLETSFRNLKYLSHLRLNLEKSERDHHDLLMAMLLEDRAATRKEVMEQLAHSIPSLRFISWLDLVLPNNLVRPPFWIWRRCKILKTDGHVELRLEE
ncbi:hypothetical protein IW262DRAFT_277466 [Armillaria fumosa]|nr:hypothetical protein IW262DRAFT_277466 [Armillaria fumosa]